MANGILYDVLEERNKSTCRQGEKKRDRERESEATATQSTQICV